MTSGQETEWAYSYNSRAQSEYDQLNKTKLQNAIKMASIQKIVFYTLVDNDGSSN